MFDSICIIWLYPIKMIERDSVWLDLIPSFQYSTWLKMQNIAQTACHLNFLNGMVLHMVIWWCGISTPTYHWAKSLNCSRDQEHSQRGFGPGHVGLHQNKLYSRIQWGVFPFSCNIFAFFLQKIPSIWMQREGPTVQESCKINECWPCATSRDLQAQNSSRPVSGITRINTWPLSCSKSDVLQLWIRYIKRHLYLHKFFMQITAATTSICIMTGYDFFSIYAYISSSFVDVACCFVCVSQSWWPGSQWL